MTRYKLMSLLCLMLLGATSYAETDEGGAGPGGGKVAVTPSGQRELFDFVDLSTCYWMTGPDFVNTYAKEFNNIVTTISTINGNFARALVLELNKVHMCATKAELKNVRVVDSSAITVFEGPNREAQMAVRYSNQIYWSMRHYNTQVMNSKNRAYGVLHELLHGFIPFEGVYMRNSKLRGMVKYIADGITDQNDLLLQMRLNSLTAVVNGLNIYLPLTENQLRLEEQFRNSVARLTRLGVDEKLAIEVLTSHNLPASSDNFQSFAELIAKNNSFAVSSLVELIQQPELEKLNLLMSASIIAGNSNFIIAAFRKIVTIKKGSQLNIESYISTLIRRLSVVNRSLNFDVLLGLIKNGYYRPVAVSLEILRTSGHRLNRNEVIALRTVIYDRLSLIKGRELETLARIQNKTCDLSESPELRTMCKKPLSSSSITERLFNFTQFWEHL